MTGYRHLGQVNPTCFASNAIRGAEYSMTGFSCQHLIFSEPDQLRRREIKIFVARADYVVAPPQQGASKRTLRVVVEIAASLNGTRRGVALRHSSN